MACWCTELTDTGNSIGARIGCIFFKTLLHLLYLLVQTAYLGSLFGDTIEKFIYEFGGGILCRLFGGYMGYGICRRNVVDYRGCAAVAGGLVYKHLTSTCQEPSRRIFGIIFNYYLYPFGLNICTSVYST